MSVYAKTPMETLPGSCNECAFGRRYGCVGDVECRILREYFTGNVKPPYKERPDECPLLAGGERLVELPCKVGDLLYEVDLPEYGVITCKALSVLHYCGPEHQIPGNKIVSAVDVQVEVIEGHGKRSSYDFSQEDFEKTVFLTREAAEAALKEQEG